MRIELNLQQTSEGLELELGNYFSALKVGGYLSKAVTTVVHGLMSREIWDDALSEGNEEDATKKKKTKGRKRSRPPRSIQFAPSFPTFMSIF